MEKDISEIDKNLWNKVKNTTKKLNREISYIKKPLQNITKKQNRNSISNNSTIQDSRNNENNYDSIEKKIIQQHHPKNLSDFTNIKTGVDKKTINKIKKGSFTINAKLDLHGCRLNEAEKLLKIFILEKFSKNEQNLLIISGKGKNGNCKKITIAVFKSGCAIVTGGQNPKQINIAYDFIKDNRLYFLELRQSNLFLISIIFLLFTILWVFPFLGFGSPIAIIGGFILGKWIGTLVLVLGLSIGATFLYMFGNYFLKDLIKEKFLDRFKNLEIKFKKSEFIYLLVYRFVGGIPWQLSCILPTLFNVKIRNFFFASLIGIIPQVFLTVSIGSGLEKVIEQNSEIPKITDIIFLPEVYFPILGFFTLVLITIFLRKLFYKD